jgi:hypothetical protein
LVSTAWEKLEKPAVEVILTLAVTEKSGKLAVEVKLTLAVTERIEKSAVKVILTHAAISVNQRRKNQWQI